MKTLDTNLSCPVCGSEARMIEVCNDDGEERKTAYGCDGCGCIIYIVQFEEGKSNEMPSR